MSNRPVGCTELEGWRTFISPHVCVRNLERPVGWFLAGLFFVGIRWERLRRSGRILRSSVGQGSTHFGRWLKIAECYGALVTRLYAFLAALAVALPLTLSIGWAVSLPTEGNAILASCLGLGFMDVFEAQFRKRKVGDRTD